jgi:hypothetical protein
MSYVKIDTDLGGVLHRQCSSTCLHIFYIELCGAFEVDLFGIEKFNPSQPRGAETHHRLD